MSTSDGDAYAYDAYGRTIATTADGVSQTYGYDGDHVRVEVGGVAQLWDRVAGLPTLIEAGGGVFTHGPTGIHTTNTDHTLVDAIGSVRTTVNGTGVTTGTATSDPFGQGTAAGVFGFAGEQHDPTGLVHLRARQYDPGLGRFTTFDPVTPGGPGTGGYNHYSYTANNPTTWTDPSGLTPAIEYGDLLIGAAVVSATLLTTWAIWYQQCLATGACTGISAPGIDVPWPWEGSAPAQPAPASEPAVLDAVRTLQGRASVPLTQIQAEAAVRACLALAAAANLPGVSGIGPCDSGVPLLFPGADTPETTAHIGSAIAKNPAWFVLTRRTPPARQRPPWYDQPAFQPNNCTGRLRGGFRGSSTFECDEFPFLSTTQGGPGAHVSLRPVPPGESGAQGSRLSAFYGACVPVRSSFAVVPQPRLGLAELPLPTFHSC